MATLLVSIAVSIAISLLISVLFPPPDVNQEGPRLTELGYTGAAYGRFVNIIFGTDRVAGNIIDTEDPVIEEVTNSTTTSGKGGPDINSTTYTYFFTGRVAFATEGATDVVQMYGDGKLIWDADGKGITEGDIFAGLTG